MTPPANSRTVPLDRLVCAIVVLLVGAYLVSRAALVPLTYDEAASLFRYVQSDLSAPADFSVATNHFLNSVLARVANALFGDSPWALRLPSLLAGAAYLAWAVALALRARHRPIGLAGLVLLAANPYVLDYLALSRGYGLALGLLAGSLHFLLQWLERPPADEHARRLLSRALWFSGAAVVANFSALTVFVATIGVVLLRLAWATPPSRVAAKDGRPLWSWRAVVVWALVTAAFSALVFSRERVLSQQLFSPITVRVAGLLADELDTVHVFRVDSRGRPRALVREPGGVWRTGELRDAWGLRVALPASADRNLASLNVAIGPYQFRRDRRVAGPWRVVDPEATYRVLLAEPALTAPRPASFALRDAVNWRTDGGHGWFVAGYTLATLASLVTLGLLLAAARWGAVRAGWLPALDTHAIVTAMMGVASLAAAPVYILRRNSELYFGGTAGLLPDTFASLVHGTAYGALYHPDQTGLALIALGVIATACPLVLLLVRRARVDRVFLAPTMVLGVVALVALQVRVQHQVLGTPYLTGRTAILLLPLMLSFLLLFADALASLGRVTRAGVTAVMLLLAVAATGHATNTFNVWRTFDWQDDAATPTMLESVIRDVHEGEAGPAVVRIGVEWMYLPVAQYYAERFSTQATRYDVHVVPGDEPLPDYMYVRQSSPLGQGAALQRFPESGAVLWRTQPGVH